MALVTNLLSSGKAADLYASGLKYIITTADLVALGAFTSGTINLDVLPPGAVMTHGRIKHAQAITGAGPVTAATAQVQTALVSAPTSVIHTFGAAALNVFAAVSDTALTTFGTTTVTPLIESWSAPSYLQVVLALTGGNASGITAGRIEVFFKYVVLK